MHDRRTVSGFSSRNDFGTAAAGAALAADVAGVMRPESHSVTATAEYRAGARDVLANNLVFNRRAMTRDFGSFYRALSSAGALTGRSDQRTDQDQGGTTLDYALTWRHTPDEQRNKLVTEVRVNGGSDGNDIFFSNAGRDAAGVPTGPAALETNATRERSRALFAQTDWTRELRRGTKLETGYKGIVRRQTSRFDVATATAAAAAARAAAGDGFTPGRGPEQRVRVRRAGARGRTRCSASAPGRVDLQGGLRLETADSRFDLETTGRRYDIDYRRAFPSALASFTDARGRQFKASYSKRISRPDVRQLNPFGFREDQFTVFEGNPGLRPEYTHAYELGLPAAVRQGGAGGGPGAAGGGHLGHAPAHAVLPPHGERRAPGRRRRRRRHPPPRLRQRGHGRPVGRRRERERAARPVQRLRRRQRLPSRSPTPPTWARCASAREHLRLVGARERDVQAHAGARPAGLRDVPRADAHGAGAHLALRARQRGAAPEAARRQGRR
jgi:hypothetical protein